MKGAESFNLTLRVMPNRSQTHLCHAHTPANQIIVSSPGKLYKPPLQVPVHLSRAVSHVQTKFWSQRTLSWGWGPQGRLNISWILAGPLKAYSRELNDL